MEKEFKCLNCGVEFSSAEAEQANGKCPECGADLAQVAGAEGPGSKSSTLIIIVAVILLGLGLFFFLRTGEQAKSVDEILAEYLATDAETPMMIDKSTRLDRIEIEGKAVIFKTTLVNVSGEEADDDLFKRKMGPFLAEKYCNDKNSRRAMEEGVTYGHEIFANDGVLLYTVDIGIDDC
ncbi:MAG: endonuclease Q family protein [Desulfobulbaceae bacterium]|nr:endonuclease Q family protein [Desulfobulbaceae bacterium]